MCTEPVSGEVGFQTLSVSFSSLGFLENIYLWLHWVFAAVCRLLSRCGAQAPRCGDFSRCGARALGT